MARLFRGPIGEHCDPWTGEAITSSWPLGSVFHLMPTENRSAVTSVGEAAETDQPKVPDDPVPASPGRYDGKEVICCEDD